MPSGGCDPVEAWAGAGFLAGLVRAPMLEQFVPKGLHIMEKTYTGAVHEGLPPVGGIPGWSKEACRECLS